MGFITIQPHTTKDPITLIGYEAGVCWGSDISDRVKNYKRGLSCIESNHGRTLEFPQLYITFEGYSARVVREAYTHISGGPTRLQESTRYINCENFPYVVPPAIKHNSEALLVYQDFMDTVTETYGKLTELGVKVEDAANILPLGMQSTFVMRTNLRHLIDMSRQRMCTRAYHEYRDLMRDLVTALADYSPEWKILVDVLYVFHPKCEDLGYCPEEHGCGRYPKKESK